MNEEEIDLRKLVDELRAMLPGGPIGYLRGKSLMRDVLVHDHGYSELEAEELVDTLELQGYLHFLGDPTQRSVAVSTWEMENPQRKS